MVLRHVTLKILTTSCKGNLISRYIQEREITDQPHGHQSQIQQGPLVPKARQPETYAGDSHSSCAEVTNKWSYNSTPPRSFRVHTLTNRPLPTFISTYTN